MSSQRRFTLAGVILALSSTAVFAQTSPAGVAGIVADSAGRPLASAVVSVVGTEHAGRTDARGRFRFDSLPVGAVTLRAAFVGYHPVQHDTVLAAGGQTEIGVLRLLPRAFFDSGNIVRPRKPDSRDSS